MRASGFGWGLSCTTCPQAWCPDVAALATFDFAEQVAALRGVSARFGVSQPGTDKQLRGDNGLSKKRVYASLVIGFCKDPSLTRCYPMAGQGDRNPD